MTKPASVIFDADNGRYVSGVDGMTEATRKSAQQIVNTKNATLDWIAKSVAAAKEAGASFEQLQKIQERGARSLTSITERNASQRMAALDREVAKAKDVAAEMARINKVVSIESGSNWKSGAEITRRQMASALLRAGSGQSSLRAAEVFSTMLPGFDKFASIAFPVVGAIAFGAEIVKVIGDLRQMREEQEKVKEAQEAFGLSAEKTFSTFRMRIVAAAVEADDLSGNHLAALRGQLELINQQGFDQLSSAFDSLNKSVVAVFQNIKTNWLDTVSAILSGNLSGAVGSGGANASRLRFSNQYQTLLAQGKGEEAQGLLNQTQQREERIYSLMDAVMKHRANLSGTATPWSAINELKGYGVSVDSISDFQKQYESQQTYVRLLEAQQRIASQERNLTGINRSNARQSANSTSSVTDKQTAQSTLEGLQQLLEAGKAAGKYQTPSQVEDFWANATGHKGLDGGPISSNQSLQDLVRKQWNVAAAEVQKQLHSADDALSKWSQQLETQGIKKLAGDAAEAKRVSEEIARHDGQMNSARDKQAESQAQSTARIKEASLQLDMSTGLIDKYDAAVQLANIHTQMWNVQLAELNKTLAAAQPNSVESITAQTALDKAAADRKIQVQKDAADIAAQSWSGALSNAMHIWEQNARISGQKVADIITGALNSVDSSLSSALVARAPNSREYMLNLRRGLSDSVRGVGANLIDTGLHGIEGAFFGKKQSPQEKFSSAVNKFSAAVDRMYVPLDGSPAALDNSVSGIRINGGTGNMAGSILRTVAGGLFGGTLGKVGSFFSTLFGGARAMGGNVNLGTTYLVGENGPELFQPRSAGNIIPNHALNGNTAYYNVQVANGVTPEQMNMYMRATLQKYHPHVVRASVNAMIEHGKRIPKPSR